MLQDLAAFNGRDGHLSTHGEGGANQPIPPQDVQSVEFRLTATLHNHMIPWFPSSFKYLPTSGQNPLKYWELAQLDAAIRRSDDTAIQRYILACGPQLDPDARVRSQWLHSYTEGSIENPEVARKWLLDCKKSPQQAVQIFCELNSTDHGIVIEPGRDSKDHASRQWNCIHCRALVYGTSVQWRTYSWKANFDTAASYGCTTCQLVSNVLDQQVSHIPSRKVFPSRDWGLTYGRLKIDMWLSPGGCVYNPNDKIFCSGPPSFRQQPRTDSPEVFMTASSWIQLCVGTHGRCKKPVPTPLPTRVLEVINSADGQRVRLLETEGHKKGYYVTLSHCWGTSNPACKTTTKTYQANLEGIPWSSLPRTFQEAIHFTSRLGVRYLWIDSICIVQDDKDDWARESATMASVYENSFLTLAAAKARSSDDGLYSDPTQPICVRGTTPQGEPIAVLARKERRHLHYGEYMGEQDMLEDVPLLTRGWVHQERLLSPRVLYFCRDELVWECRELADCQCYEPWCPEDYGPVVGDEPVSPDVLIRTWHALVMRYTALSLSKPSDVFPAISGLAQKRAKRRAEGGLRSRYLAGLWEDSLIPDLLWRAREAVGERPDPFRAPTWSWASVHSSVRYALLTGELKPQVEIHGAECVPATEDPMGQVQSGSLQLAGACIPLTFRHEPSCASSEQIFNGQVSFDRQGARISVGSAWSTMIHFDYDMAGDAQSPHFVPDGETILGLRVATYSYMAGVDTFLLLLRNVEVDGHWERIGLVELSASSAHAGMAERLFEKAQEMTMTIR